MNKVGIIHISSTSIRLVLSEIESIGYVKKIDDLKTPLNICYNLDEPCELNSEKMDYIYSTIKTYKSLCISAGATPDDIFAIATQSFNLIKDNHRIISMLKEQFNLNLKIISNEEEIFYSSLSVLKSFTLSNSLLIDINGTSTNLVWIKDNKIKESITLSFGHNNLAYKFKIDDRILSNSLLDCLSFIKNKVDNIDWLKNNFDSVFLIGEVSTNISRMIQSKKRYPFDSFNKLEIFNDEIEELYNFIKSLDSKKRVKIEGLDLELSNTVFSSLAIFTILLKNTNYNNIYLSNNSLREGLLHDYLSNHFPLIENNLDYSLYGILESLNCNTKHANQVYFLTLSLFNKLKELHHIPDDYLNILKTGTLLHDVGTSVNYHHHHIHSFYIILNSNINELSPKELLMSATLASYHRFNDYSISMCKFSSIINKLDLAIVDKISALLKIAEGLDRSLISTVSKLDVKINDSSVEIILTSDNNLDVEIHQALRASKYFKDIYKKDLIIYKKQ